MANLLQQKKRNRRTLKQRDTNLNYRSQIKTLFRSLEAAVAADDSYAVAARSAELTKLIDKTESKHVLHRNNAARKKSQVIKIVAGE